MNGAHSMVFISNHNSHTNYRRWPMVLFAIFFLHLNLFLVGCSSPSAPTGGSSTSTNVELPPVEPPPVVPPPPSDIAGGDQPWVNRTSGPALQQLLISNLNGSNGYTLKGSQANDQTGRAVATAQDFNGDGYADIIIGAPGVDTPVTSNLGEGRAYMILGGTTHPTHNSDLNLLNGSNGGFLLNGGVASAAAGSQVTALGDFNGDDFSDVAISAPSTVGPSSSSYLLFGRTAATSLQNLNLDLLNPASASPFNSGVKISPTTPTTALGLFMEGAGDFNGDGLGEVMLQVPNMRQSFMLFGKRPSSANISIGPAMSTSVGLNFAVSDAFDGLGATGQAGDVDGDGRDDYLVGLPGLFNGENGKVILLFGTTTPSSLDNLDLSTVASGASAVVFNGPADGGELGRDRVTTIGDINGDGLDDFALVAPYTDPGGRVNAGSVYVVFGHRTRANIAAVNLSALNGTTGFRLDGGTNGASTGYELQVSAAGDVNGDGFDDIVIGDPGFSASVGGGRVYLVFGSNASFAGLNGVNLNTAINGTSDLNGDGLPDGIKIFGSFSLGRNLSRAGDVNGDGFDDLILGAFQYTESFVSMGAVHIVFGGDFRAQLSSTATSGADRLVGYATDNAINGWGGADSIRAGNGNDVIYFYGTEVRVDGGGDRLLTQTNSLGDTLKFNTQNMSYDFTLATRKRITGIETIDMRNAGTNTVKMNIHNLLKMSSSSNKLYIRGDSVDQVNVLGQNFVASTGATVNGVTFDCYTAANSVARLCVEPGVTVLK